MGRVARCLVALRRAVSVTAGALAIGAVAPVAAEATTTCELDGAAEVLFVRMSADNDSTTLRLVAVNTIDVRESGGIVTCSGGTPTTTNTEFIFVNDESGNGSTRLSIFEAPNLAGVPITYTPGNGNLDTLAVFSRPLVASQFLAGSNGISTNGDATKDVNLIGTPESIVLLGSEVADAISARGSGSGNVGGPVTGTSLELRGGPGDDTLEGGEAGDLLDGELGNDTMRSFGGEDVLVGDALAANGDDLYDGGAEADSARYPLVKEGVTVDLAKSGPQETNNGNDTFVSVENVDGSSFADTLLGDAGRNRMSGQGGDDTMDGRGGDDSLNGGSNVDTVSYAGAPAGVTVDLAAGKAGGGAGTDSVLEFENIVGSPFADALTGSDAVNTITALAGVDAVQALGGAVQGGVILKLRCPFEACAVSLRAGRRTKARQVQLPAGPPRIVRLPLTKGRLGRIEAALEQGKRPKLRVTAIARDSAGNAAPAQLTVTAKP